MQDQDNIAQTDKENNEIKETTRETVDVLNIPQASFDNVENKVMENAANENIPPQEIPAVEYIGSHQAGEIPTVSFNAAENDEFQTAQSLEVQDMPKEAAKDEKLFMFNGYEIKTWEFNPRIYKILTGSTIFCVLALVAVAQSNVLNRRACDAPLVSKVCQVLDTVYVGSVMLGTDSDWVNEDYDKTELGNSEITYIDTSNVSPPLPYPEGYFALANPEMMYNDPTIIPGSEFPTADGFPPATNFPPPSNFPPATNFPTTPNPIAPGNNPIAKTPNYPKPNKNNPIGDLPETGVVVEGDNPIGKKPDGKNNNGFPDGDKKQPETKNTDKQPDIKSDSVADVKLNRKPLDDVGDYIKPLIKEGKVDLKTPFFVQANGKLDEDGKIKTINFTKTDSTDQDMIDVVQRSIAAINESGYLQYLQKLSGKNLNLTFSQDEENIVGEVQSEVESARRAESVRSSINLAISIIKATKTGADASQNDKDDLALLEGATVKTDGKKIIIRFNVKKDIAHPMIERKLLAPRTPEGDNSKPNSAAQTENGNSDAGK